MLDNTFLTQTCHTADRRNSAPIMSVRNLSLHYGPKQALKSVNFDLYDQEVLAFIGPSGCGKSTALKCLNRMHDDIRDVRITGSITMHGYDIYAHDVDPPVHRRRFGWVAQKPNPFPKSIFENVAYGARIHGLTQSRHELHELVETCLKRAQLWDEVKDCLHSKQGTALSGGQQQRLCIARALSTQPEVMLMDEPTGSIDPVATARVEELMMELGQSMTVVVITHSMMEARRVSDRVAYFHMGELLECGTTQSVFDSPRHPKTQSFISGHMG